MATRKYVLSVGVFLLLAGIIYYQLLIDTSFIGIPYFNRRSKGYPSPLLRKANGSEPTLVSTKTGDVFAELGDCASFIADAPIYGIWSQRPNSGNISSDPLDAVFQHGIFINGNVKLTPRKRKKEDAKYVVPNTQHYAWYSTKSRNSKSHFRFHHYLSVLSAQKFNKPDCVYFWYEEEPTGDLWQRLKEKVPNLILVYREGPTSIYGKKIDVPEHKSDVVRLEAVLRYGGLYTDLDVIVLKPFTDLRVHDMTMGYESVGDRSNWLCNGIMQGKANNSFSRIWHKKYTYFNDAQWGAHSVVLPATLAREYPKLIHTEIDTFNRPNWQERAWLYDEGKIWDWNKNYAVHLWFRFHNKDHNVNDIKSINTTMGQLFRFIVYGRKELIGRNETVTEYRL